jgi:hypothetical protein
MKNYRKFRPASSVHVLFLQGLLAVLLNGIKFLWVSHSQGSVLGIGYIAQRQSSCYITYGKFSISITHTSQLPRVKRIFQYDYSHICFATRSPNYGFHITDEDFLGCFKSSYTLCPFEWHFLYFFTFAKVESEDIYGENMFRQCLN